MFRTCFVISIITLLLTLSAGNLFAQDDGSGIVFTGCPPYVEGSHCDSMFYQVVAVDLSTGKQCPEMKYILVSGPGTINRKTGLWVFHPERDSLPSYYHDEVEIAAYKGNDTTTSDENCRFEVMVYDQYPVFSAYCGAHITVLPGDTITIPIEVSDADWCDEPRIDSVTIQPQPSGYFAFDAAAWTVRFEPNPEDAGKSFEVRWAATSGPSGAGCPFWFDVFQPEPIKFRIATVDTADSRPGDTVRVDLILDESAVYFDRVDFTVGFDDARLQLVDVERGPEFFSEETGCGWERLDWSGPGHCVYGEPTLVRIIARAVSSSSAPEPPCWIPEKLPATFATLKFVISDKVLPGEQFAPISFYWCDCMDNYLMSTLPRVRKSLAYMPLTVYSPDGQLIPPDTVPGYSGASDDCYYNISGGERYRLVEFHNGGVNISVAPPEATYSVRIGHLEEVLQGQLCEVPVTLEKFDHANGLGGFDLLVVYDASALAFQLANEGDLYDSCGWEYFTYRFGADGNCGGACPSGMIRLVGIAETNNGPYHPNPECAVDNPGWVSTVPVTLATMRFLVSNDRTLECQFVPIRFYWVDCGDNALANQDGSEIYLSRDVFESGVPTSIAGVEPFPTYRGAQQECFASGTGSRVNRRAVDFYNGGLQIICADTTNGRGDINMNGLAYEIADAVMFSNYFVHGLGAFGDHAEGSTANSDVNEDGKPLTIEDYVWMKRVIFGEAVPPAPTEPSPNPATFIWNPETGEVDVSTFDELGGIYMIIEGEITPVLLAEQMGMKFGWDTGWTKILIEGATTAGPLVSVAGASGIVSVEAATYDAHPVVTSVEIADGTTMTVAVESKDEVSWDKEVALDITLDGQVPLLGGFDLLLGFPGSLIQLASVTPGASLFEDCDWEYFTYQSEDGCGAGCPEEVVRVIGVADINNGTFHPSCYEPVSLPATLLTLRFYTGNQGSTECRRAWLRFFWQDCTDNMIAELDGMETYVSRVVMEAGSIVPREAAFPTYGGTPDGCLAPVPAPGNSILRRVNYTNGWLDFICTDTSDHRGDIDLNEVAFEIADAEMFTEYFIHGLSAFDPHVEGSVTASDVNADGTPLTVPDLVFLIRVMTGEADQGNPPPVTPSPSRTHIHWQPENGLTWVDMPDSLGAMYVVVAGEVTPTLLVGNMQMKYGWEGGLTKILIYSFDPGKAIRTGLLVSIPGALDIVHAETASYIGRAVNLLIMGGITDVDDDLSGTLPSDYALYPNYPNPFNPSTTVRYDLPEQGRVQITVYNMLGQVVRTLVDRQESPGQHETIWDGRDDSGRPVSSGLYLYRMTAGDFTESRKMLLLK